MRLVVNGTQKLAGARTTPEKIGAGRYLEALRPELLVILFAWQGKAVVPAV